MGDRSICSHCQKASCACVDEPAARIATLEAALSGLIDACVAGFTDDMQPELRVHHDPWLKAKEALSGGTTALDSHAAKSIHELREQASTKLAAIVRLRGALNIAIKAAQDAHEAWDSDQDMRVGKILMALAGYRKKYRHDIDKMHAALEETNIIV